jgi:hypothetical protein
VELSEVKWVLVMHEQECRVGSRLRRTPAHLYLCQLHRGAGGATAGAQGELVDRFKLVRHTSQHAGRQGQQATGGGVSCH